LERLSTQFLASKSIASFDFVYKYAKPSDIEKSKVLEVTLDDCREIPSFVKNVLESWCTGLTVLL